MDEINGLYKVRNITDFRDMLDQSVVLFGDEPAFKVKQKDKKYKTINYREFRDDVRALGTALWGLGLQGSKIAVMGPNSYEWGITYLAVTCGLGIIVPIDKELPPEDVRNILEASEAKTLIVDKRSLKRLNAHKGILPKRLRIIVIGGEEKDKDEKTKITLASILEDEKMKRRSFSALLEEGRSMMKKREQPWLEYAQAPIDPDALSVLIFTSGTSGNPKGVMLSQHNICFVIMSNSSVADIHPGDQMLAVLPLHHTFECSLGFLAPIYNGCCNAFSESILQLPRDLQAIQPTVFFTVPLMVEKMHDRIIRTAAKQKGGLFKLKVGKAAVTALDAVGINISNKVFKQVLEAFGGRIRLFIIGAAAVRPDVIKDYKKFGITSYLGYGLTECAPLVSCNCDDLFTTDTVGRAIPGVEIRIENPNAEGVGEVLVKGPNVMLGYYNDEEQTKQVIEDGWLHTGDLGLITNDGLLKLCGRAKNVIVTKNGENIYPEEIEDMLNASPYIAESMVVGEDKDEKQGTIVGAKVFPNFNAIKEAFKDGYEPTAEDISNYINGVIKDINKKLPSYKNIMEVSIRDNEFIKTTTAKIKRFANMDNDKKADVAEKKAAEEAAENAEVLPADENTEVADKEAMPAETAKNAESAKAEETKAATEISATEEGENTK